MTTLSEQEFRIKSDKALEDTRRALMPLADEEDFEIELQNGVLNLTFEETGGARFVVSPNAPTRQIWVAAIGKGYKLPWVPELDAFALDGEPLAQLLKRLIQQLLDG